MRPHDRYPGGVSEVPREAPRPHDALRMMVFASEKGQRAREAFQTGNLYVEHGW